MNGAVIMGFFATVWWVVGLRAAGHGPALVYPLPLAVAAALAAIAWHLSARAPADAATAEDAAEQARRDRLVMWASAAEGLAIFVFAGVVLPSTGHREATAPVIALIVGAHFVPLARGLPAPAYYGTAAALACLGLAGFAVADLGARITLVSMGAAAVLWLTAAAVLRSAGGARLPALGSPAA